MSEGERRRQRWATVCAKVASVSRRIDLPKEWVGVKAIAKRPQDRRLSQGEASVDVRGPVRLIHHKNLKHPHTLCKLVNAAAPAPRVVVGATACAMRDPNEIRVHEISDGSPWLD